MSIPLRNVTIDTVDFNAEQKLEKRRKAQMDYEFFLFAYQNAPHLVYDKRAMVYWKRLEKSPSTAVQDYIDYVDGKK